MAYLSPTKYVQIATNYAAAGGLMDSTVQYYLDALNQIVDVQSDSNGYDPTTAQGASVELTLLAPFNIAYQSVVSGIASNAQVRNAIRILNNHIINNYSQGNLAGNALLAYFVNNECDWSYPDPENPSIMLPGCIPYKWAELCDDLGYQAFELWENICT